MEQWALENRKAKDSFLRMVESTLGVACLPQEQEKLLAFSLKVPGFYSKRPLAWAEIELAADRFFNVPKAGEVVQQATRYGEYGFVEDSRWVHRLNLTGADDLQKLKRIMHHAFELAARGEEEFVVVNCEGDYSSLGTHETGLLIGKISTFLREHQPASKDGKYQFMEDEDLAERFDYIMEYIVEASSTSWKIADVQKVVTMMNQYAPPLLAKKFEAMTYGEFAKLGGARAAEEVCLCVQTPDMTIPFISYRPKGQAIGFFVQGVAEELQHTTQIERGTTMTLLS